MRNASMQCVSPASFDLAMPITSPTANETCEEQLCGAAEARSAAPGVAHIPSPPPPPPAPHSEPSLSHGQCSSSFGAEMREKFSVTLLLSVLVVACWSLPGNAARVALYNSFVVQHSFYRNYAYFGPNCLGCFVMGLLAQLLPSEAALPLVYRALCVGFCGSFTTYSSWIVQMMNVDRFATACEVFLNGVTMPFVFYQWGHDMGRLLRWASCVRCGSGGRDDAAVALCGPPRQTYARRGVLHGEAAATLTSTAADVSAHAFAPTNSVLDIPHSNRCNLYKVIDLAFLLLSLVAAIVIPVAIYTAISHGHLSQLSRGDVYMTVLGPSGACPRYLLAAFLNRRAAWAGFPVGTLLANVLAMLIAIVLDHYNATHPVQPATSLGSWYVIALDGVSAALSTVSSFVHEVVGFYEGERRYAMAYVYVCVTLLLTMVIGGAGRRRNF